MKTAAIFDKAMDSAPSVLVIDEMEGFLAERKRIASGCQLTPLGQRGEAVLLEDVAAAEVAIVVEVIVDRGVDGGEFLQGVPSENFIRRGFARIMESGHARGRWLRFSGCWSGRYAIALGRADSSKRR